jgi:rhodanese-related sulfurtransferase
MKTKEMKKVATNKKSMMCVLVAVFVGSLVLGAGSLHITMGATESRSQTQIFNDVTPKEAYSLIQKNKDNPDFVILDVRTPKEFASEHIEDAINLDYYSKTILDDLDRLDKTKTYLIYCHTGSRSGKTFHFMKELGFQEVYHIVGGITRWKAEGLPTTK